MSEQFPSDSGSMETADVDVSEIALIGITHRFASLDVRELFAVSSEKSEQLHAQVAALPQVLEFVIVSTCNRTEVLFVSQRTTGSDRTASDDVRDALLGWALGADSEHLSSLQSDRLAESLLEFRGRDAIEHLFHVAAGLDSAVLGEPQILGQLKRAYETSVSLGHVGPVLSRVYHRAFRAAKRVRTQTGIGRRAVSVSYAAIELARQIFGDLRGAKVLLVGAGETATLALKHLRQAGVEEICIANRSLARAQAVASHFQAIAIELADLPTVCSRFDILLYCAQVERGGYLLTKQRAISDLESRSGAPRFVIDLGVPRNVDPAVADVRDLFLYSVDDLEAVVRENLDARSIEAEHAKVLLQEDTDRCVRWLGRQPLEEKISRFWNGLTELQNRELLRVQRALERSGYSTEEVVDISDVVRKSSHSLVRKIFSRTMTSVRLGGGEDLLETLPAVTEESANHLEYLPPLGRNQVSFSSPQAAPRRRQR